MLWRNKYFLCLTEFPPFVFVRSSDDRVVLSNPIKVATLTENSGSLEFDPTPMKIGADFETVTLAAVDPMDGLRIGFYLTTP